jgi:hypothetical protein
VLNGARDRVNAMGLAGGDAFAISHGSGRQLVSEHGCGPRRGFDTPYSSRDTVRHRRTCSLPNPTKGGSLLIELYRGFSGRAFKARSQPKLKEAHPGKREIENGMHKRGSGGGIRPDPDSAEGDPGQHGRIQARACTAQVSEGEGNCNENHRGNC